MVAALILIYLANYTFGQNAIQTKRTGKKIYISKGTDNGRYIGSDWNYKPGDTFVIRANNNPYSYLSFDGIHGTEISPVVIINEGSQVKMGNGMAFNNCTYIKITGTGSKDSYGFYISDAGSNGVAIQISGRSSNIEVSNIDIYKKTYGFWVKEEASCIDSLQFPNWIISNISLHNNRIRKVTQEGMYLGSTAPNGEREIKCNGKTMHPKPLYLSNIKVYNNDIDSTNRSGIQLSCAASGNNKIYNNHVSNCGFEFNDYQGNGISLGGYTQAHVYDNVISNTYAIGILVLGAGFIKINNNTINNSGILAGKRVNGMDGIMVDTRFTKPVDSTVIQITNNRINNYTDYGIRLYKTCNTYKKDNIISHNTGTINVAEGISWNGSH